MCEHLRLMDPWQNQMASDGGTNTPVKTIWQATVEQTPQAQTIWQATVEQTPQAKTKWKSPVSKRFRTLNCVRVVNLLGHRRFANAETLDFF